MKLIRQKYNYHVSLDTVEEFEKIILSDASVTSINETNKTFSRVLFHFWNVVTRNKSTVIRENVGAVKSINNRTTKLPLFAVLMGTDFSKCLPYFIFHQNKNIYIFDAWPKNHNSIIKFLNFFKVKNAFFTSSQAVEIIQSKVAKTNCYWVPEGILADGYKYSEFKDKNIDVLALGRRSNSYHKQVKNCLEDNKKTYLYVKKEGKLIFPTRAKLIKGLADTKISVCFPSNITHPERAGNIETMTIRYLQSMISKCLVVGRAPKEMIALFGYNPVIEIDSKDPQGQIIEILNNYSDYYSLIEKNYDVVSNNHTWLNRWDSVKATLSE